MKFLDAIKFGKSGSTPPVGGGILGWLRSIAIGLGGGSNASVTSAVGSEVAFTAVAANPDRIEVIIYNDTMKDLLIKFGAGATEASWTERLEINEALTTDTYLGIITAKNVDFGGPPTGNIMITEVTL